MNKFHGFGIFKTSNITYEVKKKKIHKNSPSTRIGTPLCHGIVDSAGSTVGGHRHRVVYLCLVIITCNYLQRSKAGSNSFWVGLSFLVLVFGLRPFCRFVSRSFTVRTVFRSRFQLILDEELVVCRFFCVIEMLGFDCCKIVIIL